MQTKSKQNNIFYCYSIRLKNFLTMFGFEYCKHGFSNKTGQEYWGFQRPDNDNLDFALEEWEKLKNKFSYSQVIKKESNKNKN